MYITNDLDILDNLNAYHKIVFSAFNHFLTDEEAESKVLCYQEVFESCSKAKINAYFRCHDKFLKFYIDLYIVATSYRVDSKDNKTVLVQFDNIKDYVSHMIMSIREEEFVCIFVPEFAAIIDGHFDLSHLIFIDKSDKNLHPNLIRLIKHHNLFILYNGCMDTNTKIL